MVNQPTQSSNVLPGLPQTPTWQNVALGTSPGYIPGTTGPIQPQPSSSSFRQGFSIAPSVSASAYPGQTPQPFSVQAGITNIRDYAVYGLTMVGRGFALPFYAAAGINRYGMSFLGSEHYAERQAYAFPWVERAQRNQVNQDIAQFNTQARTESFRQRQDYWVLNTLGNTRQYQREQLSFRQGEIGREFNTFSQRVAQGQVTPEEYSQTSSYLMNKQNLLQLDIAKENKAVDLFNLQAKQISASYLPFELQREKVAQEVSTFNQQQALREWWPIKAAEMVGGVVAMPVTVPLYLGERALSAEIAVSQVKATQSWQPYFSFAKETSLSAGLWAGAWTAGNIFGYYKLAGQEVANKFIKVEPQRFTYESKLAQTQPEMGIKTEFQTKNVELKYTSLRTGTSMTKTIPYSYSGEAITIPSEDIISGAVIGTTAKQGQTYETFMASKEPVIFKEGFMNQRSVGYSISSDIKGISFTRTKLAGQFGGEFKSYDFTTGGALYPEGNYPLNFKVTESFPSGGELKTTEIPMSFTQKLGETGVSSLYGTRGFMSAKNVIEGEYYHPYEAFGTFSEGKLAEPVKIGGVSTKSSFDFTSEYPSTTRAGTQITKGQIGNMEWKDILSLERKNIMGSVSSNIAGQIGMDINEGAFAFGKMEAFSLSTPLINQGIGGVPKSIFITGIETQPLQKINAENNLITAERFSLISKGLGGSIGSVSTEKMDIISRSSGLLINAERSDVISRNLGGTILVPKIDLFTGGNLKSNSIFVTPSQPPIQMQTQQIIPIQTTVPATGLRGFNIMPPTNFFPTKFSGFTVTPFTGFGLPLFDNLSFGGYRNPPTLRGRRYKYQPSFGALIMGFRGKAPKGLTGLEIRPIQIGKSKRRKRR